MFQHGQERQNTTKIGHFAVKYHVFVIDPRQICSYISNKLQLMSATVFTCLRVQHYFFEKKKKMVKHLIIKIRRIYFKICLKTSACFMIFNILCTAFKMKANEKESKLQYSQCFKV